MEPIVNTPGQTGSYQLARWVSTDKRASGDRSLRANISETGLVLLINEQ